MADKIMKIGNGSSSVDFFVPNGNITAGKDEDGRTVATVNIEATGNISAGGNITATGNIVGANIKNKGSNSQPIYFDENGMAQVCTEIEAGGDGDFVERTGDIMQGTLEMYSTALTSKTGRNIQAGTEALTAGTSPLPTGDIYIQYI